MKVSEVTIDHLKIHARVDIDDNDENQTFEMILAASKGYIRNFTGLTDAEIDEIDELTIALHVLATEMYENRIYSEEKASANKVVESILSMHRVNFV